MALVVKDRVKETTSTTGTGTLTLGGAVTGFQTFTSVLSNSDTTYYAIFESSTGQFEVGLGTFTSSGTTLARTTILESSNSGNAINLTAGAADVFITQPAEKSVYLDASGHIAAADGRNVTNVAASTATTAGTVTTAAQPNITSLGTLTTLTVDDITINGSTISDGGTLTIDAAGEINLDADSGGAVRLMDASVNYGTFYSSSSDFVILSQAQDKDIILQGNDGGSSIEAMRIDMSDAGTATFNHDIKLPDNGKAIFGAGSDLSLYHDGSHSYISDQGTGNLRILAQEFNVKSASGNTDLIYGVNGGAVTLYHNGNAKIATASTGAIIQHNNNNYDDGLILRSTLDWGYGTSLSFDAVTSSGGSNGTVGKIQSRWISAGNHALDFYTYGSGSLTKRARLDNEGNLGVGGNTSPSSYNANAHQLVIGNGSDSQGITIATGTSTYGNIFFADSTGSGAGSYAGFIQYTHNTDTLYFGTAGSTKANINSSGTLSVVALTVDDITINGSTISDAGDLTLDVGGDIILDADGADIRLKDGGTEFGILHNSGYFGVYSTISDADLKLQGNDGGSLIDALTFDMSDAGAATFNGNTTFIQSLQVQSGSGSSNPIRIGAGFGGGGSATIHRAGADLYLQYDNGQTSTNLYLGGGGTTANLRMQGGYIDNIESAYVQNNIYHQGDTDTKIVFGTNTITLATGGESEITVDTTGVRLGDTGNGYFRPVSGTYGSVEIDGGAHNGWEGYSIGGLATFMTDNTNHLGLYNDGNDQWVLRAAYNGTTELYYQGGSKLNTTSTGVDISGDLNAVDNVYVADNIYHEGDTDTYMAFATDAFNFYTAGTLSFNISSSWLAMQAPNYNYYNYFDESSQLTGTTPTINAANSGVFYITLSGNTTFTFTNTSSGWGVGFILYLTGNGSTVTWPGTVDWAGATAPDAPANGETDVLVFTTRDGSNWFGALAIDAAG